MAACWLMVLCAAPAVAGASDPWRVELGYRFLSNTDELKDTYTHLSGSTDRGRDIRNWSPSLFVQPYRILENDFQIGLGVGPLIVLADDARHLELPVTLTLGRTLMVHHALTPYLKVGVSHHFAHGDFYARSMPGLYAGVGIRTPNTSDLKLGMELAWDAAVTRLQDPMTHTTHDLRTGAFTAALFADF